VLGNLDAGMAIVDRHLETRFIIDHLGILQRAYRRAAAALARSAEGC